MCVCVRIYLLFQFISNFEYRVSITMEIMHLFIDAGYNTFSIDAVILLLNYVERIHRHERLANIICAWKSFANLKAK